MSTANELVVSYLAAWNERDAKRRRELVAKTWSENRTYVDAHRRGEGHDAIDAMIRTAQEQFPGYGRSARLGAELTLASSVSMRWSRARREHRAKRTAACPRQVDFQCEDDDRDAHPGGREERPVPPPRMRRKLRAQRGCVRVTSNGDALHVYAADLQTCEHCGGHMRWKEVAITPRRHRPAARSPRPELGSRSATAPPLAPIRARAAQSVLKTASP
jgi:hypothetical protein